MDEGSSSSGFQWILARLPADVRHKHCAQAVHDELVDVQTRLDACCEAVAHAEQVAVAIAALEAQHSKATVLRAPGTDALLAELRALQRGFRLQLDALLQPFAAFGDSAVQRSLLAGIHDAVASRGGESRLAKAVALAREFVESCAAEQHGQDEAEDDKPKRKAAQKWRKEVVGTLSALRSALLEQAEGHAELLPPFSKTLRKLGKRDVELESFCRESDLLLRAQEREVTEKQQRRVERHAKKKRKLSDVSVGSSASSARQERTGAAPAAAAVVPATPAAAPAAGSSAAPASTLSLGEARALLAKCSRGLKALREQFTKEHFDETLTHIEAVAASLAAGHFTFKDIVQFSTIVFTVVEHVEKVKQPVKRKNRLVRLEAVLRSLADDKNAALSNRGRAMVHEYLVNCQKTLSQLRASLDSSSGASVKSTGASAGSSKVTRAPPLPASAAVAAGGSRPARSVANPMVREADRVKQEEVTAAPKPRLAPQPPSSTKAKLKIAHVHFD